MTEKRIHTISFKATEEEFKFLQNEANSESASVSEILQKLVKQEIEKKHLLYLNLKAIFGESEGKQ